MRNIGLLSLLAVCLLKFSSAQQQADTTVTDTIAIKNCEQKQIGDLFRRKDKPPKPPKDFMALILPNVSSNPSNGLLLGVGGAISWYMGPQKTTRVSTGPFTIAYTSKKQLITFMKPNIYLKENKYFFQADWRFYIYSQPTYGLGTNAPETGGLPSGFHWEGEGGSDDSVAFPMNFNYIKLHQIANKKIRENFYAGIGYHFDYYYAIEDKDLNLNDTMLTPHYVYSYRYEFDTTRYILSGLSANLLYDSRDNMINAYRGIYANLSYRYNLNVLGSGQDASSLWAEFRYFRSLLQKKPRNVLAFWLFGDFAVSGHIPYLTLPALGEDQRARSGRGYTNGRYRGKNIVYGEAEWRFPISPCSQILGGVLFVNATTTDNPDRDVSLFEYIQPAAGFGLRFMVNKHFRTNINLDYAIGRKTSGFYFSGQETF